tara:strand:- start:326 stop:451 length:126 start_codon:yes stop_codon:yes gene_type:complete
MGGFEMKTLWTGVYEGVVLIALLAVIYALFGVVIPALMGVQ